MHNSTSNLINLSVTDLDKVGSPIIRDRLFAVLEDPEAGRYDRVWFAGFLKSVGYSLEDICSIIDKLTSWSNYDPNITWLQVRSVFHGTAQHVYFSTVPLRGLGEKSPGGGFRGELREERNRLKYHTWDEYKQYLLNRHPKEWYGNFDDSGVCCKCGLAVVGCFNLHIHHLLYEPVKTSFIHAGCHNPEYHYLEKMRREGRAGLPACTVQYTECKSCPDRIEGKGCKWYS